MRSHSQAWSDGDTTGNAPLPEGCISGSRAITIRCQGFESSSNEVLYLGGEDVLGNVVLFPGDVQHLHHRMVSIGHEEFSDYCVESTARVLARRFPGHAVWVVLPKTHVHGALASYDNFAKTDWGSGGAVLKYVPDGAACQHLEALLSAAADEVQSLQRSGARSAITGSTPDITLPLTLVGFSKGVVVLNQLVTELACEAAPTEVSRGTKRHSSKGGDSRDGDGFGFMNKRKRSRMSTNSSSRCCSSGCVGGERLVSSEGGLTNPPSPADDGDHDGGGNTFASNIWPMALEGGRDLEGRVGGATNNETCLEHVRGRAQDGHKQHQDNTGSLWARLWSTFGMSRFRTRALSSTTLASASSTDESENDDGHDIDQPKRNQQEKVNNSSRRTATKRSPIAASAANASSGSDGPLKWSGDKRQRRKRPSASTLVLSSNRDCTGDCLLEGGTQCERSNNGAARRLFDRVVAVHWVDGANAGVTGSFPTNLCSLARLAALPNLSIRVHGTPYQWASQCRPWLASEASAFLASIEGFRTALHARGGFAVATKRATANPKKGRRDGVRTPRARMLSRGATSVKHGAAAGVETGSEGAGGGDAESGFGAAWDMKLLLYFESEQPSLENHFRVLTELNTE